MPDTADRQSSTEPVAWLDSTAERRAAHMAQAALLAATAWRVASTLPLGADVDDFRRVLIDGAPVTGGRS